MKREENFMQKFTSSLKILYFPLYPYFLLLTLPFKIRVVNLIAALGPVLAPHRARPHFVGPYIRRLFQSSSPKSPQVKGWDRVRVGLTPFSFHQNLNGLTPILLRKSPFNFSYATLFF